MGAKVRRKEEGWTAGVEAAAAAAAMAVMAAAADELGVGTKRASGKSGGPAGSLRLGRAVDLEIDLRLLRERETFITTQGDYHCGRTGRLSSGWGGI